MEQDINSFGIELKGFHRSFGSKSRVSGAGDLPHGTETQVSSGDDVELTVAISRATGPSGVQIIESNN